MVETIHVKTSERTTLVDITPKLKDIVGKSAIKEGLCLVYCPHTTAAITINENCDPSVQSDLTQSLCSLIPCNADYAHAEGNSDAHIKSSLIGSSQMVIIKNGTISLGTWQGVFFCEFDGPRSREVWVEILTK